MSAWTADATWDRKAPTKVGRAIASTTSTFGPSKHRSDFTLVTRVGVTGALIDTWQSGFVRSLMGIVDNSSACLSRSPLVTLG